MLVSLCKDTCHNVLTIMHEMDLRKPAHSKIFVLHIFCRQLMIRVSTVETKEKILTKDRLISYFYFFAIPDYRFPIIVSGKRFTKLRPP